MSSSISSNGNNQCSICLESLADPHQQVGAVVPCGHCLHTACWDGWVASRMTAYNSYGNSGAVKCPNCNTASVTFVRLFADFGGAAVQDDDDDDDDWSLSSHEQEQMEEEDENQVVEETPAVQEEQEEPPVVRVVEKEVIVIDSDDEEEEEAEDEPNNSSSKSSTNNNNNPTTTTTTTARTDKENKYKRKAKEFKQRVAQLQGEQKLHYSEKQKILDQIRDQKEEIGALEEELEELTTVHDGCQRTMERLRLQVTELNRKLEETTKSLRTSQNEATQRQKDLEDLDARYKLRMKQASASSMAEVQRLLEENPRLQRENKELREKVLQLKRIIGNIDATKLERAAANPQKQQRRLVRQESFSERNRHRKEMVQALDQVHNDNNNTTAAAAAANTKQRKSDGTANAKNLDTSKMSAQAVRMAASCKPARKQPISASVLGGLFQNNQPVPSFAGHFQPLKKARQSKNAPLAAPAAKTLSSSLSLAGKKRRALNQGLQDAAKRKQKKSSLGSLSFR